MMPATIGEIAALPAHLRNLIDRLVGNEVRCEREACARIVEDSYVLATSDAAKVAACIRARGTP